MEVLAVVSKFSNLGAKLFGILIVVRLVTLLVMYLIKEKSENTTRKIKKSEKSFFNIGLIFVIFFVAFIISDSNLFSKTQEKQELFIEYVVFKGEHPKLFIEEKEDSDKNVYLVQRKTKIQRLEISNDMNKDHSFEYTLKDIGTVNPRK